jgi:hypothetical protein
VSGYISKSNMLKKNKDIGICIVVNYTLISLFFYIKFRKYIVGGKKLNIYKTIIFSKV